MSLRDKNFACNRGSLVEVAVTDGVPSALAVSTTKMTSFMSRHAVRLAVLAALVPVVVDTAGAADQIYWGDEQERTIGVAPLADPINDASILGGVPVGGAPCGVTIDVKAEPDGKIYWADFGDGSTSGRIRVKNLDGSGDVATDLIVGETGACGVSIDPATRKIYWATFSGGALDAGKIRVGTLSVDGLSLTSAGDLVTGETGPSGVAIDTTNRFIYWTNQTTGEVRRASLDILNQTDGDVTIVALGEAVPLGLALDLETGPAGTLYWASYGSNAIRRTSLDGLSSPETLLFPGFPETPSGAVINPAGIAIDLEADRFYWANSNGRSIWSAKLSGDANLPGSLDAKQVVDAVISSPVGFPVFPALLRQPSGTAPPAISGDANVGTELTCSEGTWAPDMLGAFLYRAPRSVAFQWKLDGSDIAGAEASSFTPGTPGAYTCEVMASNHAGSTSQSSPTVTVLPTLSLRKFYDANANGADDDGGAITGWRVQIDGVGAHLTPKTVSLNAGNYVVRELAPSQTNWVATTPKVVQQLLRSHDTATVSFGNLCVGAGGAKDTGFWKSKAGATTFVPGDLQLLGALHLRTEAGGDFNPTSYSSFATWIGKASGTNMAYALSAQLAAMALNVGHGMVNVNRLIQAPGTTSAQNSASNSFATVGAVMAEAEAELAANAVVKGGSPFRAHQAALQDALLKANTNKTFVQTTPCAFTFP